MKQNTFQEQRRVLVVVRWPVGGIRTYILYNYPLLVEAGYRFTFVGPADESFREFRGELESWPGTEFAEVPVAGRKCKLRSTVPFDQSIAWYIDPVVYVGQSSSRRS